MIKNIRTNKFSKVVACYLVLMIFLELTQPMVMFALTAGPAQPEFNSFTPLGTSDMVDLASGDFNYNIPIMDVGGYPINLAYSSGINMDQESSWVGLGWNLNIGQINRNVRGLPDDFKGDIITNENNLKKNITVGVSGYINPQIIGALDNISPGGGMTVQYNNYTGVSAVPSYGVSFKLSDNVSVGTQISSSNETGASITPSVSISAKSSKIGQSSASFGGSLSPSVTYNSRQGLTSFNLAANLSYMNGYHDKEENGGQAKSSSAGGGSGSISFVNNTFTPVKRLAFKNDNITFSFSGGPDLWGAHIEGSISAFASVQSLKEKKKFDKSYGYENTEYAGDADMLDFNREKEQPVVTKNTLVLPVTNYTYDILTIQGQGIGGTVRPFRGQVGYVYDPKVTDISASTSFGAEVEGGAGGHVGASVKRSNSTTYTGAWNTVATPFFKEKVSGNNRNYERVYYKNVGETRIDQEYNDLFTGQLGGYSPITFRLDTITKQATNEFYSKEFDVQTASLIPYITITHPIKRIEREKRNQVTQKITKNEVIKYGLQSIIAPNINAKSHHTAGYIVTDENGSRNIFGVTAYNKEKSEVTFATNFTKADDLDKGLVSYYPFQNTSYNSSGRDNYFNKVTTPAFAHTYLLSSILSSDFEDLTNNGPTDDDLGNYTKFEYQTINNYNWRIPFGKNKASFNGGFETNDNDQKGSYLYGKKELKYVTKIVTKTHVAFIDLEDRLDGYGVKDENGGLPDDLTSCAKMQYIKSIRLYSKPEVTNSNGQVTDPGIGSSIKPIKTAYFEYDYSLCPGIDNNSGASRVINNVNTNQGGKLTLKKVYFTYKNSNMGRYAAYKFNYRNENYTYNPKNYDIWGNYMKNDAYTPANNSLDPDKTTPQQFPYVMQTDKTKQDEYAAAWSLSSIDLPSGGKINLSYETDDYKYVQNKRALQMFKIEGVCSENDANDNTVNPVSYLYGGSDGEAKYVIVKLNEEDQNPAIDENQIIDKYIGELAGKPIFFNFYLNMTQSGFVTVSGKRHDYVTGYFEMDKDAKVRRLQTNGDRCILVPMKYLNREGKHNETSLVNPISLTGWFFGRENLHYQVYDNNFNPNMINVVDIAWSILSNLSSVVEIFKGANGRLKDNMHCAKDFNPNKSWIRLQEPRGIKYGGGCRIKKIEMYDNWDKLLEIPQNSDDIARYQKKYGQEYKYALEDGTSSGVATYEPNVCKENPLVEPFYHLPEKMAAASYQEKPFGESFFPNPTITYSKVTVKNITAADDGDNPENRKTKSGTVVTTHYTSKDFPTKTDFTPLVNKISHIYHSNEKGVFETLVRSLFKLNINVKIDLTMTQGFTIETNDMNGKVKKQEVINNAGDVISSVEYKYSTEQGDDSRLNSELTTINKRGFIENKHALGMHYDVINDFRESYSYTNVFGGNVNVDVIPIVPIPLVIGMVIPEKSKHTQILRTAVTTKVISKTGILVEKIATDLGSSVTTKNLAWDADTGQVLLTQTINEFDDKYYTMNFPAYWYYNGIGMASENIDITGVFRTNPVLEGSNAFFKVDGLLNANLENYFKIGDEIILKSDSNRRLWVSGFSSDHHAISLIKSNGVKLNSISNYPNWMINNQKVFRIIRSANKNQQMSSMASITLMRNPLLDDHNNTRRDIHASFSKITNFDPKIINASAIEYNDLWRSQCENGLPEPNHQNVNNYLYNIKGEVRPIKSYAYLTGRNTTNNMNIRKMGYFKEFMPFYQWDERTDKWLINTNKWTAASEVTKYNPYGVEIENKDALNRYSSAQYGYNYKLPVAVASNSEYKEMGFDGFEDYKNDNMPFNLRPHFGFSEYIDQNASYVTDKASHTGKKSILIRPGRRIYMVRKIDGCRNEQN